MDGHGPILVQVLGGDVDFVKETIKGTVAPNLLGPFKACMNRSEPKTSLLMARQIFGSVSVRLTEKS
jgi:hypothetical protein